MELDKINNKIIVELLNNCRKSNIQIGKKVGLSREGVANRIRKLEKAGVILNYGLEVNLTKLGFMPHEVSLKLQRMNKGSEEKIVNFFKDNKKIVFVEKALGKFDFVLMVMVKSLAELDEEIEKLRGILGSHLKEISICAWIANYDTMSSFFTNNPESVISRHSDEEKVYVLDSTEKKLLRELALKSRESAVYLSKKLNISAITVANKIKLLEKKEIIKTFRAAIDFEKLGVSRYSIYINVSASNVEKNLAEFCKHHKLIADFTKFIGEYNYSIEVFAKNNEEFQKVVNELLDTFSDSIVNYETMILLEEIKHIPFYS
ncbi:MAG: Lrp/AsnC family transcriptional regulator [Candidatus Nanoarchaeia archaeon]|nr:Lrp/AsnC family transcriptional regulator [Candidatus Nanoarchaeia archaeon]MDD5699764.1 Lrp/AsnC family transcriptional regulator [Candidatus Nanoarchaeia archaeon]